MANIQVNGTGNANLLFGGGSGNANLVLGHKSSGSGGTGDCVFWAIYDVTTNAEIENALESGKIVCCTYEHNTYMLDYRSDYARHVFVSFDGAVLKQLFCAINKWSAASTQLTTDGENNIILWADYGETTSQEIYDAMDIATMLPCVRYSGLVYTANYVGSSTACQFISFFNDSIYTLSVENGVWTQEQIIIATASDIPTKVSDLTNDAGYITSAAKGAANGVCPLDGSGLVSTTYLPHARGIYWATYGTTTGEDISDALVLGNLPAVNLNGMIHVLHWALPPTSYTFIGVTTGGTIQAIYYNDGVWSIDSEAAILYTEKGSAGGVCPLNSSGKIDASYLPVYSGGVSP